MKSRKYLLLSLALLLTSCDKLSSLFNSSSNKTSESISSEVSTSFSKSSSSSSSFSSLTDTSSSSISSTSSFSESTSSISSISSSTSLSSSSSTSSTSSLLTDEVLLTKFDDTKLANEEMINITSTNYKCVGSYNTGNFSNALGGSEILKVNGFSFEHYRAKKYASNYFSILPFQSSETDGTIRGSFSNTSKIPGISRIFINYKNEILEEDGFIFLYGNDVTLDKRIIVPASISNSYICFDVKQANYFSIQTSTQKLQIKNIMIYYTNNNIMENKSYLSSGDGEYRLNPNTFKGTLENGISKMTMPIKVDVDKDGTYDIVENRTYTYYTYDYIEDHPNLASEAAMTDPVDVASYYLAFQSFPANYVKSSSGFSAKYQLFKNDLRQVSTYDRTDGYVRAIPVQLQDLLYHEFDIDIGNTYINSSGISRGVGRVIIFTSGFNAAGYDDSPVAVYSDDHYATFQEYLNTGEFGPRFNAQNHTTQYIWGLSNTLN